MKKEILTIERLSIKNGELQHVARVPMHSGTYETVEGDLTVAVFHPRKDYHQKVVFSGPVIPTVQERGKRGQFRSRLSYPRRVVNFPAREDRKVIQPLGKEEYLVFSRRKG